MTRIRPIFAIGFLISVSTVWVACVGDEPATTDAGGGSGADGSSGSDRQRH
ncbi:MAG: hypothetical protein ACRELY_24535 [Polyangiaceae bacterium]